MDKTSSENILGLVYLVFRPNSVVLKTIDILFQIRDIVEIESFQRILHRNTNAIFHRIKILDNQ